MDHCLCRDYKFYLSFENSICDDYVTEKFFNILKWVAFHIEQKLLFQMFRYNVIPITYNGVDMSAVRQLL